MLARLFLFHLAVPLPLMDWKLHHLDTYVISGSNDVSRSAAATAGSNSLCLVYITLLLLSGFTGTLTFSYLEGELNDIAEGDLVLELQADDDSWTTFGGTVDQVNNTVSYTFNDPVSFKAVTATSADATLTIEDIYPLNSRISVYPNPTANRNLHSRRKHFTS